MPSPSVLRTCLFLLVLLPACGGGESRPGPLQYTLDDMYIAKVPLEEKQGVLQAQNDFAAAKMERATAEAEYSEAATELQVAKNELGQAELDEESAKSRKQAAEESGDMNRVNAAAQELRAAKLAREAAAKKVEYMKAQQTYLKKRLLQAEDEGYAKEARYELTKARLAQANNIRPKGFEMPNFQRQSEERSKHAQRSKALLQRDKAKADTLRREWQTLDREAQRARGGGTSPTAPAGQENL